MIRLILLLFISNCLQAQTLKLKLVLDGDSYTGTMNPKWFDRIQIIPAGDDLSDLQNASGSMIGSKFGRYDFTIVPNSLETEDMFMIKMSNGWYPVTSFEIKGEKLKMAFPWDFRSEASEIDLAVLQHTSSLLSSEETWNSDDDRICEDDISTGKYSIYCALQRSYLDLTGDFNHRAPALELVRQNISLLHANREYQHQLMEFNNEQSFQEVKDLLFICEKKMEEKLAR